MTTATKTKPKAKKVKATAAELKQDLRILRAVAEGHRTPADLKKKLRKDVKAQLNALKRDGSLETIEKELVLTKRGAGRLRFAHLQDA
jgi:hypothetical protein